MSDPEDRAGFRYALGFVVVLGGLACLAGLYFVGVPAQNRDAVMLALGVVLGWGSAVVAFEFGSSPSERKVAAKNAHTPTGQPDDPVNVTGAPVAPGFPSSPTDQPT